MITGAQWKLTLILLSSLHSVYLLARITLETWLEERANLREFSILKKSVAKEERRFKDDDNLNTEDRARCW